MDKSNNTKVLSDKEGCPRMDPFTSLWYNKKGNQSKPRRILTKIVFKAQCSFWVHGAHYFCYFH